MTEGKDLARAKDLAFKYLALRPRSRTEVLTHLERKQVPEDAAKAAVEALEGYGYIDDVKFARGYARYIVDTKGFSRFALGAELMKKGVSREDARTAVEALDDEGAEDDESVALRVAAKKAGSLSGVEPGKARRRLVDHLRRRGFSFEVIRRALRTSFKD